VTPSTTAPPDLSTALVRYRVMAYVIGVLLIVLVCIGVPLKYLTEAGGAHDTGEWITTYLGIAHGYLYMVFLVMAALLARRAGWGIGFTITTLLLGTVPLASFYGERRATASVRAQMAASRT
jgi:integral membrane protein